MPLDESLLTFLRAEFQLILLFTDKILVLKMDKNKNIQLMPMCHEHGKLQGDRPMASAHQHFIILRLSTTTCTVLHCQTYTVLAFIFPTQLRKVPSSLKLCPFSLVSFLICHHHMYHGSCVVRKLMALFLIFTQGCQDKSAQEGTDLPLVSQGMPLALESLRWEKIPFSLINMRNSVSLVRW